MKKRSTKPVGEDVCVKFCGGDENGLCIVRQRVLSMTDYSISPEFGSHQSPCSLGEMIIHFPGALLGYI